MVQVVNAKGQLHQDLMLVDRELMRNDITVDHHHTLLSDALTLLYRASKTPQTKMTEKSTNKGYLSNVTLAEMSTNDHEQLTESEKKGGHGEFDAVDIGEEVAICNYARCYI